MKSILVRVKRIWRNEYENEKKKRILFAALTRQLQVLTVEKGTVLPADCSFLLVPYANNYNNVYRNDNYDDELIF